MVKVHVAPQLTIKVQADPPECAEVNVDAPTVVVDADGRPYYTGSTTVVPQAHQQTVLETSNKILLDDITVTEVPYYATSNSAGGQTVFIADTLEVS